MKVNRHVVLSMSNWPMIRSKRNVYWKFHGCNQAVHTAVDQDLFGFERYPRRMEADAMMLEDARALTLDMLFSSDVKHTWVDSTKEFLDNFETRKRK